MIITRTPYRISLFGGATDYPEWFESNGGAVLAGAIDKYCYITARKLPPFFPHKSRVVWSEIESVKDVSEIRHPAVRTALEMFSLEDVEIHHQGDLPARSGIGSSSAFAVGLIQALYGLWGALITEVRLIEDAIHLERDRLGEAVGWQDQVTCAKGGVNLLDFGPGLRYGSMPIPKPVAEALADRLLLVFTGIQRTASDIARDTLARDNAATLRSIQALPALAVRALTDLDWRAFAELLDQSWWLKRTLSPLIAPPEVDDLYALARRAGATGGKLLGAGGGGFMLFMAPPEKLEAVRHAVRGTVEVPFRFEWEGARIVYHSADLA